VLRDEETTVARRLEDAMMTTENTTTDTRAVPALVVVFGGLYPAPAGH
jgi:hypothetical protein